MTRDEDREDIEEIEDIDFDDDEFEALEVEDLDLDDIDWDETEWSRTDWEDFVFEQGALHTQERDDERFQVFLNMEVDTPDGKIHALSGNVSDGGVFVATPHAVEPGTVVTMHFKIPKSDEMLTLRGEVRWIQEEFNSEQRKVPGFGAKFIDLVSEDRYKLFRYIDELKRVRLAGDPDE
jgi:uncharacterized protein (TIGR02266 family)